MVQVITVYEVKILNVFTKLSLKCFVGCPGTPFIDLTE